MFNLHKNNSFLTFLFLISSSSINACFLQDEDKKTTVTGPSQSSILNHIKSLECSLAYLPDEVTSGADGTKENIRKTLKTLYQSLNQTVDAAASCKAPDTAKEISPSVPLQQPETHESSGIDILSFHSSVTFKDLPQEWQLNLGSSLAEIKESFFETVSEQQRIQSLWSPENLKSKKMLILRGQKFLDLQYITNTFTKNLLAFPNYVKTATPTLEQMTFSLLFNQPNSYAIVRSITQPNKGRICFKYGFILEVPFENIYFVSCMDSQLPPSDENIKTAQSQGKNFKEVLLKSVKQTPEEVIEMSSADMNNEVGFVPSISIDGNIHTIRLAGFYAVIKPDWTRFKFSPPQFASK